MQTPLLRPRWHPARQAGRHPAFQGSLAADPRPDKRPLLVYNTGRLLQDAQRTVQRSDLPAADYLICGVGTLIHDTRAQATMREFADIMSESWDRGHAEEVVRTLTQAVKQPSRFQNAFKSSWYLHQAPESLITALQHGLREAGIEAVVVYSSSRDLDILPKYANKGNALEWLLGHLGIPAEQVIVAGDSGNDSAMFLIPGVRGIVVENAQPELVEATLGLPCHRAQSICADGVIEGLVSFGVLAAAPEPGECGEPRERHFEPEIRQILHEVSPGDLTREEQDYLRLARAKAVEALRKNITPLGFSACSLSDNETKGTDANYRSVWARDGAITLIASLSLPDEDLRDCQRATLRTLLENTSPHGQIPANVRIDDGQPDYSGVGGISSIDSGLWVIIAAYEYQRATRDTAFIRGHLPALQKPWTGSPRTTRTTTRFWKSPKPGTGPTSSAAPTTCSWTRSSGTAPTSPSAACSRPSASASAPGNTCAGPQSIKLAILQRFWPTTSSACGNRSFADMQYSLGDTAYLLAQVTPFDFNWRCDVYGNILAFLFNVLDMHRARSAFRFMWGVGVNDPHPVANLYPVVAPGDPDWKPYYAVNLLNLPHHYHNGGIWPFIGGKWVQFISRLGMRQLALQELLKLAKLNQRGVQAEWEFNEWAHARTGNPMGKAYQAWSAAEFILACHEVGLEENGA